MTTLENRTHALAMVTEDEIRVVREVLVEAGLVTETVRHAFCLPEEPPKAEVLAGTASDRRYRVALLDIATGQSWDTVVSTDSRRVVSVRDLDPPRDGQPPIMDFEFEIVEGILNADQRWLDALAARDIDPAAVRAVPLAAGVFDYPEEVGRGIARAFGFRQDHDADHPWAHPIDGLVAYVDLINHTVDRVIDTEVVPVPHTSGNFDDPEVQGPPLEGLKPIEITQPEGRSFTVEGNHVRWGRWDLRYGFNEREGLTLHQIAFDGRPIVYRALHPEGQPTLLADDASSIHSRATFATKALWVTPVRPRAALPRRRLRLPAPRRRRAARLGRRRPRHRRPGHRPLAHLRAHPLPPPRGLAGHARGLQRLHPQAQRVLRPQPRPRRTAVHQRSLPSLTRRAEEGGPRPSTGTAPTSARAAA